MQTKMEQIEGKIHVSLLDDYGIEFGTYEADSFDKLKGRLIHGKDFLLGFENFSDKESIIITDDYDLYVANFGSYAYVIGSNDEFITTHYEELCMFKEVIIKISDEHIMRSLGTRLKNVYLLHEDNSLEQYGVKQVLSMHDIDFENMEIERYSFGRRDLDKFTGGASSGTVTLISGKAGAGKSVVVDFLFSRLLASGIKCFTYSGEMSPTHTVYSVVNKLVGGEGVDKVTDAFTEVVYGVPKAEIVPKIKEYLSDKFWVYDTRAIQDRSMIEIMYEVYCRFGVRVFNIDNVMSSPLHFYTNSVDKNEQQKSFVQALKNFAVVTGSVVYLVAHPRKFGSGEKADSIDTFSKDDISGSADMVNLVDNLWILARAQDKDREMYYENPDNLGKDISVIMKIVKDRKWGREGYKEHFMYSYSTGRFLVPSASRENLEEQINENYIDFYK